MKKHWNALPGLIVILMLSLSAHLTGQGIPEEKRTVQIPPTRKTAAAPDLPHEIMVYETSPPYAHLTIEEGNIFADDVKLANPGKTVITKIRANFYIYSPEKPQELKLWIFEDLNQPPIHTQVVGTDESFQNDITIGLSTPVTVPQHFYIGFSAQGNESSDRVGISQRTYIGESTEDRFYYGTVEGGMLTDTFSTQAAWKYKTMCLEVFTASVDTVIARYTTDVISGPAPLHVRFHDASASPEHVPIMNWQWDFETSSGTIYRDQNQKHTFFFPGIYSASLRVSNADGEMTYSKPRSLHAFGDDIALHFDGYAHYSGTFAYAYLDRKVSLTETVTFEAWIYPTDWGSAHHPDTKLQTGYGHIYTVGMGNNFAVYLYKEGHPLFANQSLCAAFKLADGSSSMQNTPENSIRLNEWQHIAVTYDADSSQCKIYINGVEQVLQSFFDPLSGPISNAWSNFHYIGNNFWMDRPFQGRIDEARLWEQVQTQAQIQANMDKMLAMPMDGLAAYWPFIEGSGGFVKDLSGHGFDLSIRSLLSPPVWSAGVKLKSAATSVEPDRAVPHDFLLLRNYPNPFNPETTIQYNVKEPGETALTVFDVTGRKVIQLMHGPSASGSHEYRWNGKDAQGRPVPSGIYFCRLNHKTRSGEMRNKTLKMMLLK